MIFGRVEGLVELILAGERRSLKLTVLLDTAGAVKTIRSETVPMLRDEVDGISLSWQADQYTQETIGVDLALEGWEIIGAGDIPEPAPGEIARSASYTVRRR